MADKPIDIYKRAYSAHFYDHQFLEAIRSYRELIAKFPASPEAQTAEEQIAACKRELAAQGVTLADDDTPRDLASEVILTSAQFIEGYVVNQTVDIVGAECVFGMNVFRDLFAGIRDVVGGRSDATQRVIRDSREVVLRELRLAAVSKQCNAVIALQFTYSQLGGQDKSMMLLCATGTAVRVSKRSLTR